MGRLSKKEVDEYLARVSESLGVELRLRQYAHADDGRHWYITYGGSCPFNVNSTPLNLKEVKIFLDGACYAKQMLNGRK